MATEKAQWLLADTSGKSLITFTSFIDADIRLGGRVVSEAVESGSFASYNKLKEPADISVTLAVSGTSDELQTALNTLIKLKEGTDLFSLVTPEYEYKNLTLESLNFKRSVDEGVDVIYFTLSLLEVEEVTSAYSTTSIKYGQAKNNSGGVSSQNTGTKTTGNNSLMYDNTSIRIL